MIRYSLYDASKAGVRIKSPLPVSIRENKYIFDYPCEDSSVCTEYSIVLQPGLYKFELYGASGGSYTGEVSTHHYETGECMPDSFVKLFNGNTRCLEYFDYGGAGGYVSGLINVKRLLQIYATIGGSGKYLTNSKCDPLENCYLRENMVPGGYGGGGSSPGYKNGAGSGGGQTSVKFLENTLYHRVIVSGGGGGADDYFQNDARGGSGGGLVAQGWWNETVYNGQYLANSSFGFTFGTAEAAPLDGSKNPKGVQKTAHYYDKCGGGGGWFGGFSSNYNNAGCGGGSSWVLTKGAYIPPGLIESRDEFYNYITKRKYNFDLNSEYLFTEVIHVPGIWQGNGCLIITVIKTLCFNSFISRCHLTNFLLGFEIFLS
ncbi:hypothetical protein TVAG_327530 [Trichomonas vaginalis G3]|uniref:receptor protein-tyrosine kinase n=1 Tax=Trichomonas vaginalis (strain ATCC PRA-98 / G3) TaxID=412133 RepID=A2FRM5_TRIV3|nr:glycine-rich protein family [Trichomonas vaginalis G3]EAX92444.1 hypothetical protein TVAG_327530 [Trichomonas vaginalis G3]KAI5482951.1 glycine-rich protein family [Trichomonas vaginalis G3]|eukprot:XP_001305374.1 hypothetical protein [Trichomonas vaginalis G3]